MSRYDLSWYVKMLSDWRNQGGVYPSGVQTTYGKNPAEPIGESFTDYVMGGLQNNGIVFALELKRLQVFSQARFQFQHLRKGRPGDLWGDDTLRLLEEPWTGGTTGDMLARMLLDADFAGNNFQVPLDGELVRVRPDWVEIVLAPRRGAYGQDGEEVTVGYKQVGILYYEGGIQAGAKPAVFVAGEYSHFAPLPDPLATYRGMSWLTPVIREIQSDTQATKHKLKFFENGATPNMIVSMPKELTFDQFQQFSQAMKRSTEGTENAYKTLFVGGGADVTVVGANMQQLDFKVTQGAGETRLAAAAGVHPVIAGLSEGMQGSSLNAGNYSSAKRSFVDTTCRHLWQNAAGSLQMIVPAPSGSRLWYDARDIPFLAEDAQDRADIMATNAQTVNSLTTAGYTSDSIIAAVTNEDFSLLVHSGLFSVQLQPPTTEQAAVDASGVGPKVPAARAVLARRFDPDQPRNPHDGKWIDTTPGSAIKDALKLAGRIDLGDNETLVGSGGVDADGGGFRIAAIDRAGTEVFRVGFGSELYGQVVIGDDLPEWNGNGPSPGVEFNQTAELSRSELDSVVEKVNGGLAKAKADPDAFDVDFARGSVSGSRWGDVHYHVYQDEAESGPKIILGVLPKDDPEWQNGRDWDGIYTPAEWRRILRQIESVRTAPGASRAAGHDVTPGHEELHHYWTRGKGLPKWHDFTSLYNHLVKYVGPVRAKRMAAQWFHERFGFWPGDDKNRVMHGKAPRGHRVGPG